VIQILHYVSRGGRDIFGDWFEGLKDRHAQARIALRVNRLAVGNFGDCKSLRNGVFEMRIDWGPGYRIYYAVVGRAVLLLLCAGDKRTQAADIERACNYLRDYKERTTGRDEA